MKIKLLLFVALLGFGCKKETIKQPDVITYEVEANKLLIYIQDNEWKGQYKKHFVVQGKFRYEFERTTLDTAYLEMYHGVGNANQHVKAYIRVNGRIVKFFNKHYTEWTATDTLTLKL